MQKVAFMILKESTESTKLNCQNASTKVTFIQLSQRILQFDFRFRFFSHVQIMTQLKIQL